MPEIIERVGGVGVELDFGNRFYSISFDWIVKEVFDVIIFEPCRTEFCVKN